MIKIMSNEIDGVNTGILPKIADVGGNRRVSSETPAEQQGEAPKARPADTVALTDNAKLLARIEDAVAEAPEVDAARVDAIKASIQDGSYKIDDRQIADKILRSDVERG
ncbi:MAG: flagellar biosynthesis anti-sigma factor FlgM [Pseudomonadota bacterium]